MSQAEELLNSLSDVDSGHTHPVTDQDGYFIIDPETRTIRSATGERCTLMQFDHNSERYTFELPRFIEGHDMMLCNRVRVHFNNIQADGRDEIPDVAEMYDLAVSAEDPSKVVSSWLITRAATQLAGILSFLIQYECIEDGVAVYEWHTDIYADVDVKPGRNNGEQIAVQYSSILEQWYERLFGTRDSVLADIADATEAHKEALERKAEETLATIPSDYTELYNTATDALRTRANAIVENVEGDAIITNDCSSDYLRGLRIFGRSTQNGVPTPDAPVEITSVVKPIVNVYARNLCNMAAFGSMGSNGASNTYDKETHTITLETDANSVSGRYGSPVSILPVGKKCTVSFDIRGTAGRIVKCGWDKNKVTITLTDTYKRYSSTMVITTDREPISFYTELTSLGGLKSGEYMQFANVQIEYGDTATEYETYRTAQTFELVHTLHGIPVSSGGNYTDADGQQWICDEVDFERGVHIQRIGIQTFNNAFEFVNTSSIDGSGVFYCGLDGYDVSSYTLGMMSDKFRFAGYDTHNAGAVEHLSSGEFSYIRNQTAGARIYFAVAGVTTKDEATAWLATNQPTVYFPLKTPVETALTDDEIFVFKMLHSNYPNTTILNDAGVWMEVAYNADTELFFNNSRGASDEQVASSVDAWLQAHFPNVAEVGM